MPLLTVEDKRFSNTEETEEDTWSEAIVFCPRCKAFQTVWMNGDMLMPTRKFTQEGSQVYHDCGSAQPCRLYRSW